MQTFTKSESQLVSFTSSDAKYVDSVLGAGRFTCTINNATDAITHAVKIVPIKVLIPNVFPNITSDQPFVVWEGDPVSGEPFITFPSVINIPTGFYSIQQLISFVNTHLVENTSMGAGPFSFDENTNRVSIGSVSNAGGEINYGVSYNLWRIMGFTELQISSLLTDSTSAIGRFKVEQSMQAGNMPHMGTTPIVYVKCSDVARNNMMTSSSTRENVLCAVSMSGVTYGEYATHTATDIFVDDIDYRKSISMHKMEFELVGHDFKPLMIDPQFPVIIILKVFHVDTHR